MIKILITGDFCPWSRVAKLINDKKYEEVFGNVRPLIQASDYSIVNLESPVVINEGRPIKKYGPHMRCSPKAVEALKYTGFNLVTLANNHFYDYGDEGVNNTLAVCRENDLDTVGGGENLTKSKNILYKEIKEVRFAFLNFCEHEFSIATDKNGGSNPLNPVANYYQILEARKNTTYVIVIVHGGHENYQLPSPRMKESYRFFIDSGADAVINYHQHCYSGYEVYNGKPIFYGLGNFCFDWDGIRNSNWNKGYIVKLIFDNSKIDFEVYPYTQGDENPGILIIKDPTEFKRTINNLNGIIDDDEKLSSAFDEFSKSCMTEICLAFEPYSNRYLQALRRHKFIPSFLNHKRSLLIKNLVQCEAHKDIVVSALSRLTDGNV